LDFTEGDRSKLVAIRPAWCRHQNFACHRLEIAGVHLMKAVQDNSFSSALRPALPSSQARRLKDELAGFAAFGKRTVVSVLKSTGHGEIPVFTNEFWTSRQRAAASLHEISYRACFKPQLPRFFIERLTLPGDIVYDPFMGRGTTLVEAALLGRIPFGCDANPLSRILTPPRLNPPGISAISARLAEINFSATAEFPESLLVFYHPETLREICALKQHLLLKQKRGTLDGVDAWIWMVATNRLTGHSPGFFSVYTLPPNQAVSVESQTKINRKRNQTPPRRLVPELILRKSRQLLSNLSDADLQRLSLAADSSLILTRSADDTPEIQSHSVALAVTSPPFLDVVDYEKDNWLRAWFGGVDMTRQTIWQLKNLDDWEKSMGKVMSEIRRVLQPGGWLAFEVGEVRNGKLKLENSALKAGAEAGLHPVLGLINDQVFTKTSNCWGIHNREKGTNTNRIILFQKCGDF
jgi:hypothetical protein